MIQKMAMVPQAFTKKGNAKNVKKAKDAYEQLGWTVVEEFVGTLSNQSYLIVEGGETLEHPNRPIIDKVVEPNAETRARNERLVTIREQIDALNITDLTSVSKAIASLPDVLTDDEQILGVVSCIMDGAKWLIVATQQRALMIDEGLVRSRQKEVYLKDITSIEAKSGLMNADIEIVANASNLTIKKALSSDAKKFVAAVKAAMVDLRSGAISENNPTSADSADLLSQINKLSELKNAGALTDKEFAEAKAKLLEKL